MRVSAVELCKAKVRDDQVVSFALIVLEPKNVLWLYIAMSTPVLATEDHLRGVVDIHGPS
jgi:hypothetical protein